MAATIKDIAKKTGLGLATISSYLNGGNVREQNRLLIEEAIKELHFEVNESARSLKTNKTRTVGVVIPELNNIFFAEIITGIEDILRQHGYGTLICDCRTDKKREREAVEFLHKRRVDGIINMPVSPDASHLQPFQRAGKPIVLIDRKINGLECDCVLVDNLAAAKNAVQRLIAHGHTKIGIVGGPEDIFTAQERFVGYQLALMEAGIVPDESLVAHSDYTIQGGVACTEQLIRRNPDMTAIFTVNYETTVGVMIGANELGVKIPEELSVIGFDNEQFARACRPRLTIVMQPTEQIAAHVAELMLYRLGELTEGAEEFQVIKLQTAMTEGMSVRRI